MTPRKTVGRCPQCRGLTEAAWSGDRRGYVCADCGEAVDRIAEHPPSLWSVLRRMGRSR